MRRSNDGHWARREDGAVSLTRYTLAPAPRREMERLWIALDRGDDDQDPHVKSLITEKEALMNLEENEYNIWIYLEFKKARREGPAA